MLAAPGEALPAAGLPSGVSGSRAQTAEPSREHFPVSSELLVVTVWATHALSFSARRLEGVIIIFFLLFPSFPSWIPVPFAKMRASRANHSRAYDIAANVLPALLRQQT